MALTNATPQLQAMSNWKTIRLELGRTGEFPAGSVSRGFLLRVPLNDEDFIDEVAFEEKPNRATARRYWSTEPDETGVILRSGNGWAVRCNGKADRILKVDDRPVRLGQHISIIEPCGAILPFRIASIR